MQDHIRRVHPEYYIPRTPGTVEGFHMMIDRPRFMPQSSDETVLQDSQINRVSYERRGESFPPGRPAIDPSETQKKTISTHTIAAVTAVDPPNASQSANEETKTQRPTCLTLHNLPGSWNETHVADKMMFYMRQEDAKWKDVARKWREMTGGE